MTIDGTNIFSFGMFIKDTPQGLYDLPARKKTTAIDGTESKDIVYSENNIEVELIGEYTDYSSFRAGVEALKTALRGGEKTFVFTNYSKTVTGHVAEGASIEPKDLAVNVKFKIQVTV